MKKVFITILLTICLILIGCEVTTNANTDITFPGNSNLIAIEGASDLYYYSTTHIVYIVFNRGVGYKRYGYMAPCYSSKGNLCIYDSDKKQIIEIEK